MSRASKLLEALTSDRTSKLWHVTGSRGEHIGHIKSTASGLHRKVEKRWPHLSGSNYRVKSVEAEQEEEAANQRLKAQRVGG